MLVVPNSTISHLEKHHYFARSAWKMVEIIIYNTLRASTCMGFDAHILLWME